MGKSSKPQAESKRQPAGARRHQKGNRDSKPQGKLPLLVDILP